MAELYRESLSKLTVAELKNELSARNLSISGLKGDLVARLREAVESEHCYDDISDNAAEMNWQSKKVEEKQQLAAQEKESALENKFMQLLSFMTEMKEGQKEMKREMKVGQEEISKRKEEISKGQEEMETNIVKVVNVEIDPIEGKFEKLKQEMCVKIQLTEELRETSGTSQEFRLAATNQFQNAQHMPVVNDSCMKLLPYDGKTSWQVYKTQFAIVAEANGWDLITKARQLQHLLKKKAVQRVSDVTS